LQYRLAVHYWDDNGHGSSYATVRVFVHGMLVFEEADVELKNCEMWEVGTLEWPSGTIVPATGSGNGLKISSSSLWCFEGDYR